MAVLKTTAQVRSLLNKLVGETAQVITVSTNASPSVQTIAAHGYSTGDVIFVVGMTGNTNANGLRTAVVINANTFSMLDFFTGSAVNGNGTVGGSPTAARVKAALTPGDLDDLQTTLQRMNVKTTGQDENRANESSISTILGA